MTAMPPPVPPPVPTPVPTQSLPYAAPAVDSVDVSHLNLLGIFYFVLGPLLMLFGSFPIVHIVLGAMILNGKLQGPNGDDGVRWIGLLFIVVGATFVLIAWTIGLLSIYAGLQLRRRRRWMFCMVIASAMCVFMPLGTILGIFTIVVLMRPTVRPLFS